MPTISSLPAQEVLIFQHIIISNVSTLLYSLDAINELSIRSTPKVSEDIFRGRGLELTLLAVHDYPVASIALLVGLMTKRTFRNSHKVLRCTIF